VSSEERIVELEAIVAAQAAVIAELRAELEALKDRLGRDSGNSSLPPSRDGKDRRQRRAEEREARKAARRDGSGESGRRPGKQPGAPGVTMRRREPEVTVTHTPVCCDHCAADLAGAVVVGTATRQVVDIPEPRLVVTDHVVEKRRCLCGYVTVGAFPAEATGPTCWGPGVKAAAVYLMVRQHVPLERAHEAMEALFGAPVSEGTLANWTLDTAERLAPFIAEVKALLQAAPVVCADETPVRCGTGSSFVHTVSTDALTLLAHHPSRGIEAITAVGVLDNYQGVIMHDGLNVYTATELAEAGHAQCHAHLDRHLIDVGAWHKHTGWAEQMRRVLVDAQAATHHALAAGLDRVPAEIADPIRRRYEQTLTLAFDTLPAGPPPRRRNRGGWLPKDRDAWNLATRFRLEVDQILRLLDTTVVPASNNHAERSLRMCKIHDKISGLFRNPTHAAAFCTIRSYIQTGHKHDQPTLPLLQRLYTGPPWLPTS
jgi:transposase